MPDTVIRVENLGKKYAIGHQQEKQQYTTLRDVIANSSKGLAKRFRRGSRIESRSTEDFWALKDVSFEIKQGDRVGIIGRNGAGKSTLLKILSRITEPTTGRIEIKGRVASLLEVGTGFHAELTGRENIFLNGAILGMGKSEISRKFDEIVAFSEVERFLDTPVKRYSSGMYVRLAFAVAAHLEPEILVVDEVLAVGDIAFQKKCLGRMDEVSREGRTVLFVSHNMTAIRSLCNSGIFLSGGQVLNQGEIKDIVTAYEDGSKSLTENSISFPIKNHEYGLILNRCDVAIRHDNGHQNLVVSCQIGALKSLRNVGVGLTLKRLDGTVITYMPARLTNYVISEVNGTYDFSISCKEIDHYLVGDLYTVDIWLSDFSNYKQIIMVEEVAKFEILASDTFGTGNFITKKFGLVPLPLKFFTDCGCSKA
ncbi:MAG: polysaccharide ABC transporter ATP-binding protein [Cyanobacteria bacterium J06621_3]